LSSKTAAAPAAISVARAQPDGCTLLVTTPALAINETLHKNNPFKLGDFTTVANAASSPEAIMTSPDNPAQDLPDLIRRADGKPITFGSSVSAVDRTSRPNTFSKS
jgi:tripartite-type tricarboxylate transporter receptor subunit TctC